MRSRYLAKSRRGGTAENRVVMIRRRKAFAPSPMRVRIYNFLPMKARRCPAMGGMDPKSQGYPVQRFARERERAHRERHPPLARLLAAFGTRVGRTVNIPLYEAEDRLLPRLGQVTPQGVGRESVARVGADKDLVQREAGLAGERELREGVGRQVLLGILRSPSPCCSRRRRGAQRARVVSLSLSLCRIGAFVDPLPGSGILRHRLAKGLTVRDPTEAVSDEEGEVDQGAVGGVLDLKVAKERVGPEQGQGFVDDVGLGGVGYRGRGDVSQVAAP